jgi:hypothetical protein
MDGIIVNLPAIRAAITATVDEDGISPLQAFIDGRRTPIRYEGDDPVTATKSVAFVRDANEFMGLVFLYPDVIVRVFDPRDLTGYQTPAVDTETGEQLWDEVVDEEGGVRMVRRMVDVPADQELLAEYRAVYDYTLTDTVVIGDGPETAQRPRPLLFGNINS